NYMKQQLNKSFTKTSRSMKGPGLTFDFEKHKEKQPNLLTGDENLEKVALQCCNKTIKVQADQTIENIYCPFCGVN
ncbi:hypothetical protein ACEF17_11955, partial [Streptococcus hyovaginalis]